MSHTEGYLIFKQGGGYYRAGCHGYTLDAAEAGRFSLDKAVSYSHPNGPDGPRDGITYKHESEIMPDSNCESDLRIHDLTQERDALREGQEMLSQELTQALDKIDTLEAEARGTQKALEFRASLSPV
jgi:hypothetical protein